ncbi:MAG: methanogen output domain 1-containing protein [Sumerlaeia bacterium]
MTNLKPDTIEFDIDRDKFLRQLIRELALCLEEIVGIDEASGLISIVAHRMGLDYSKKYKTEFSELTMTPKLVGDILVDFKRRIGGDFFLISADNNTIILGNRRCPFEDKVLNRPALCMMTTNVFGVITSQLLGYAKVHLQNTIASGDHECRVLIYLNDKTAADEGKEFFRVVG